MRRLFIGIVLLLSIGTANAQEETAPPPEETPAPAPTPPVEEPAPSEATPSGEEAPPPPPKKKKRRAAVELDGGTLDPAMAGKSSSAPDAADLPPKIAVVDAGAPKNAAVDAGRGAPRVAAADAGVDPTKLAAGDAGSPPIAKPLPTAPIQVPSSLSPEAQGAFKVARAFFDGLLAGDARGAAALTSSPFDLDDKRYSSKDDVYQRLVKELRDKRTDLLTLYGIEVLSPADMEKKYGKPPARLSSLQWKNPNTYVAVANLSGHAAIAVLRSGGSDGWHVVAYTD